MKLVNPQSNPASETYPAEIPEANSHLVCATMTLKAALASFRKSIGRDKKQTATLNRIRDAFNATVSSNLISTLGRHLKLIPTSSRTGGRRVVFD
jgi:hypothetical protein